MNNLFCYYIKITVLTPYLLYYSNKFTKLQDFFVNPLDFLKKICYNITVAKKEATNLIRKRIEVVITGLTRNQLYLTVPWVRIPPLPPRKKPFAFANGFFQ